MISCFIIILFIRLLISRVLTYDACFRHPLPHHFVTLPAGLVEQHGETVCVALLHVSDGNAVRSKGHVRVDSRRRRGESSDDGVRKCTRAVQVYPCRSTATTLQCNDAVGWQCSDVPVSLPARPVVAPSSYGHSPTGNNDNLMTTTSTLLGGGHS